MPAELPDSPEDPRYWHLWESFTPHALYLTDRDMMGELVTILDLLASYLEGPGFGGYFREEFDAEPTILTFRESTYGPVTD